MSSIFSSSSDNASSSDWSSQLEEFLRELQQQTILLAIVGLAIIVITLMSISSIFRDKGLASYMALGIILLAITVWVLSRWNYLVSAIFLNLGTLAGIFLFIKWTRIEPAIFLLILPVGFSTLTISRFAGLLTTLVCSVLLITASSVAIPAEYSLRLITLISIWSVFGMLYLTLKPMMTTIGWAWSGYKSSQELLEQSRDFQMQLQQTLKDLEDVNMQLTRLNKQAHTLRIIAEEERATKERFVANVSHELRTPLYMIIGFCEMITQSPETYGQDIPEALLADLAVVLRNSQHLQSLIDDVLDLSQIEAGHMALRKERISIAEIIQAATIAIKPLFTSKGLYLKTEIIPDLPPLFCDRTRIREVLLNLLSNAGRFTERGGVCVRAWQEDNTIIISVADTGPGILASEQAKLFQPFHQLDNAVRPKYGSSGLGLSISRSFVELHSGKMWVESTLGSGATFFFRLPIEPVDTLEPGPSTYLVSGWEFLQRTHRSLAPVPNISPRVVIVEKGTALLHLIRRYMDQVEIIHVADIDQALVELSNVPSQALLVNDVNNTQPLQRLVADRNLPPFVPAIICSIPEVEDTAVELGVIDYLVKPVSAEKLFTILDKFGEQEIQTILVVDDEPDVLRLFARVLTEGKRPYRVLRASNGREALEILTQERVDLIFLDLIMPEIDGYQFLILKNTDPHLKTIPSIVVTAQNPFSQPMTCNALTVTCRDGLTASQILDLVEAIRQIFVRAGSPDGQASVKVNSG